MSKEQPIPSELAEGDTRLESIFTADAMTMYAEDVRKQKLLSGRAAEVALAKTIEAGIVAEAVLLGRQQARDEAQGIVYQNLRERLFEVGKRWGHAGQTCAKAREAVIKDEEFTEALMRRFPEYEVSDEELAILKTQGFSARDHFIRANTPLAMSMAAQMRCRTPLPDRVQWANLGLIRAVDKFDHRRGIKFSTHASWWIKQSLSRENENLTRIVRLPGNVMREVTKIARAEKELAVTSDTFPTDEQIVAATGLSLKAVQRSRPLINDALHFEGLLANQEDGSDDPATALGLGATQSAERSYEQQEHDQALKDLLARYLNPEDVELLYSNFLSPEHLDEHARQRGMSVRQVQSLAYRITLRLKDSEMPEQLAALRQNIA